jgi:hypothetical protein
MRGKMKKLWIYDAAVVALVCLGGLHCELYQKISGPRQPAQLQPAPAGTVTIGGSNYERILSIQETSDKGLILGGYVNTNGFQGLIIRTNQSGDTIWTKTGNGNTPFFASILSVRELPGNGYLAVANGNIDNAGNFLLGLLKTDAVGGVVYQKIVASFGKYIDDCGYCGAHFIKNISAAITSDFGFIMIGSDDTSFQGNTSTWIYKINAVGDTLFLNKNIDTTGRYTGSLIECVNDGYIIAQTHSDIAFLLKADANGNVLWKNQVNVTFPVRKILINSIKKTADNCIILAGGTNPATDAVRDAFLVKTDANGNLIWSKTYDGSMDHKGSMSGASAQSVLPTPDGGVVVLGITTVNLSMNLSDVWLFKVNANGDTLWSRSFGGGNEDYGRVIAPTSDGGFIIGAETESYGSGGSDIWLIKTDASGNLVPLK